MKQVHPHPLPVFAVALALLLSLGSTPLSAAKVDLEQAKAELAKAKAAEEQAELVEEEAEQSEEKTPRRRRLFGRDKAETDKPVEILRATEQEAQQELPEEETTKDRNLRSRFFKRFAEKAADEEEVELEEEAVPAEEESPRGLKRFSPFSRAKDIPKDEEEQPEVAKAEPQKEQEGEEKDGERRRLLGGLFSRDSSQSESAAETKVEIPEPAKIEEKKSGDRGSMFGWFRRGNTEELAKADKTKLGKSIESIPSKPSSSALTKKSASAGELGWYVVTESSAPFYAIGPGQPMPPEKLLDRGSMLTVTKGGWGWCNVKLGSGELGVVSTKAMRPATVAEVSRHSRSIATAGKPRGSRRLFNILSRGPAPTLDLPTRSGDGPIRNFGLLPPISSSE